MAEAAVLVDPFALLVVVVVTALVFDYINGFHDTANAIATVVSTNVLSPRTAVMLAACFNFGGAFLGTGVATTIGGDIADPVSITQTVVVCALLAGIIWNLVTWAYGLPSSSTSSTFSEARSPACDTSPLTQLAGYSRRWSGSSSQGNAAQRCILKRPAAFRDTLHGRAFRVRFVAVPSALVHQCPFTAS